MPFVTNAGWGIARLLVDELLGKPNTVKALFEDIRRLVEITAVMEVVIEL